MVWIRGRNKNASALAATQSRDLTAWRQYFVFPTQNKYLKAYQTMIKLGTINFRFSISDPITFNIGPVVRQRTIMTAKVEFAAIRLVQSID